MVDDTEDDEAVSERLTEYDIIYWMGWHMDSQRRIYDVLLGLLASATTSEQAKQLQELHAKGEFLYPPLYAQGDEDETD